MTIQDEFSEAEEAVESVRKRIVDELSQHDVSGEKLSELKSMLNETTTGLMNAALELTRDELLTAKCLTHETGWMLADAEVRDNRDIERVKLLEEILDNLRSEELVLGELTGDLRAQTEEIRGLEEEVEEATKQQAELWNEICNIKAARGKIAAITYQTDRLEEVIGANKLLKEKLETQRLIIEDEIQALEHERQEKSRMHDHWIMERRAKETQISTLHDELYIAQQGHKKRETGRRSLVDLITSCKAELVEVKSINLEDERSTVEPESRRVESMILDRAILEVTNRIETVRESRVRQAVDSN